MLGIADARNPLLINTVGHSVGLLLFSVLVGLLIADWRRNGIRQTGLTLTAATLALLWNLGSLLVLASSRASIATLDTLVTFSFSVLTILPAVLLNVVLPQRKRLIVASGYAISLVAIALAISGRSGAGRSPAACLGCLRGVGRICNCAGRGNHHNYHEGAERAGRARTLGVASLPALLCAVVSAFRQSSSGSGLDG